MPTSLDDIKKYQQNSCQSVYEHINGCRLCQQLYNPPNTTNLTSASQPAQTTRTPSSVWIISIVLIIFIGIFIYQKFI
jgi:hypothetical protein